jgi:hypothetical protein
VTKKTAPTAEAAKAKRLSPVALVKAVFTQHLRLRRGDRGIEIVLGEPAAVETRWRDDEERAMQVELCALLDAQPGSRKVLRALAVVEHQLRRRGDALFIHDMKPAALRQTLRQLDAIAPSPGRGIVGLRNRLNDALSLRERLAREDEERRPPSSFIGEGKLHVREGSLSDFESAFGAR